VIAGVPERGGGAGAIVVRDSPPAGAPGFGSVFAIPGA